MNTKGTWTRVMSYPHLGIGAERLISHLSFETLRGRNIVQTQHLATVYYPKDWHTKPMQPVGIKMGAPEGFWT